MARKQLALLAFLIFCSPLSAHAQSAPYDRDLLRLAETMGSIHYLTNVCDETGNIWRDEMTGLLAAEQPSPARRARLIAAFNRGYRAFDSVYRTCTEQARISVDRYVAEAISITKNIETRYAN